jgi:hypothetical protein
MIHGDFTCWNEKVEEKNDDDKERTNIKLVVNIYIYNIMLKLKIYIK